MNDIARFLYGYAAVIATGLRVYEVGLQVEKREKGNQFGLFTVGEPP